jgi:predicted rRNA methylase YqxC with S4 and FtsJ domains
MSGTGNWIKLRNDPRVIVSRKSMHDLFHEHIPELVDICVIDVSVHFIDLNPAERIRPDNLDWSDSR